MEAFKRYVHLATKSHDPVAIEFYIDAYHTMFSIFFFTDCDMALEDIYIV